MAYVGTGTQAGGRLVASGQLLWNIEWVLGDGGVLYLPPFRLAGTPQLHVVVEAPSGTGTPAAVDVTVTIFGPREIGVVTGDLIGTGRYAPIRQPIPLAVPSGEARSVRWDYVPHPDVIVAIADNRDVPTGPFPLNVSIGATS